MKKFLQKSCAWLVMLVAMFAMSMSAMAQEEKVVEFDLTSSEGRSTIALGQWGTGYVTSENYTIYEGQEINKDGVYIWASEGDARAQGAASYERLYTTGSGKLVIASKDDGFLISKVDLRAKTSQSSFNLTAPADGAVGWDEDDNYFAHLKWPATVSGWSFSDKSNVAPVSQIEIPFTGYSYIGKVVVTLVSNGPAEAIEYHVNFIGEVPADCSVSLDGNNFSTNGSVEIKKNLGESALVVNATADYYADVEYNEDEHTYTVEFKHWLTYNVSVNHIMGALVYNGDYYANDDTFKSKTVVDESAFSAYDLNGYDEAVSVTQESEYVYNVTVTYTESAPITYTVTFNIVPEGAYAWIKGVKYEANGTFQSNLELSDTNIEQVYCPEGYYDNSYYRADEHTFYINYIEYDKYYVVVEGTDDSNAGVFFDGMPYGNGSVIYSKYTLYDYYLTPNTVSGYNVEVTIDDHTVTVTYTEKSAYTTPWNFPLNSPTNRAECTIVDANNYGTWEANSSGFKYSYNQYYGADDYIVLPAVVLEGGKTYDVTVNCNAASSTWYERMEVVYGTVADVEEMDFTAIENTKIDWTSAKDLTARINVAADGKYYFAIHATSDANMYYLYAYSFSIVEYKPLVEDAKLYTLTAVTRSGSRYNWCVKDGAVVPSTTEAATPFVCEYHGEKVAFKTLDGKYLRNHDRSDGGGTSWLDAGTGSATGLADAYDDALTTLTFEKFPTSGSNISWTSILNGELYAIKAARGLQNGVAHPGYFIMKNDGTFVGAATDEPFFTDNYTSAFEVAEYVAAPAAVGGAMDNKFYGTYYADYAWEVPAGYTAYYASNVSSSDVTLTAITSNVVAANVGVVLEGDASSDNIAITMSTEEGFTPAVNYLHGFTVDVNNYWDAEDYTARFYKLSYNEDETKVGFYWDTDEGWSISTKAYKAFLELPTALQSNGRMNIIFGGNDTPTGIDTVLSTEAADAIYNLQGQRVNAAKGGVYVKGGKKIIVK